MYELAGKNCPVHLKGILRGSGGWSTETGEGKSAFAHRAFSINTINIDCNAAAIQNVIMGACSIESNELIGLGTVNYNAVIIITRSFISKIIGIAVYQYMIANCIEGKKFRIIEIDIEINQHIRNNIILFVAA